MADNNTNATNETNANGEGQNNTNTSTEKNQNVDIEKTKSDAIAEYLKTLGVESDESLKDIVTKAKEAEEANKSDLQKKDDALTATTKELVAEKEARLIAEAKLSAIQLGAKPDLVDDLVIVAKAKVTKDKDINAVIAEMKDGTTGKIYFSDGDEGEGTEGNKNNVTRKRVVKNNKKPQDGNDGDNKNTGHEGTMAERLLKNRAKTKSHYFK
jgi:hypothetical protein